MAHLYVHLLLGISALISTMHHAHQVSGVPWNDVVFTEQPESVVIEQRQSLQLNCSANAEAPIVIKSYSWRKDGTRLKSSRSANILDTGALYIRRAGRRTDGTYECLVNTDVGSLLSEPATITVARPRKDVHVKPAHVTASYGEQVQLQCSYRPQHPAASISWQHNQVPLTNNRSGILFSGYTLQLWSLKASDSGTYICSAGQLSHETISSPATLSVTSSARNTVEVRGPPSHVNLTVSETALLQCTVTALPHPSFSWTKDGRPVVMSEKVSMRGPGNLQIANLSVNDSGTYICIVQSSDGSISYSSNPSILSVIVPPTIVVSPASQEKDRAHVVRLNCRFSGTNYSSDLGPNSGIIRWTLNGEVVEPAVNVKIRRDGEVVISQLNKENAGIYQCWAQNNAGVASAATMLKVIFATESPGAPFNVKATALSSTEVRVTWETIPQVHLELQVMAYSVHYRPTDYVMDKAELQKVVKQPNVVIKNLQPGTKYTFFVVAYNPKGASAKSDIYYECTNEDVPRLAPITTAHALGPYSLLIQWELLPVYKARGVVTEHQIWYRIHTNTEFLLAARRPGDVNEMVLQGLQPETSYDVRVLASTSVGYPVLHSWPFVTTATNPAMPAGPLSLYVKALNATAVLATWSVAADILPMSFKLALSELMTDTINNVILIVQPTTEHHLITKLSDHTWYQVRLYACRSRNATVCPWQSSIKVVKTQQHNESVVSVVETNAHSTPTPPASLNAEILSDHSILLSWQRPAGAVSGYVVRYVPVRVKNSAEVVNDIEADTIDCKEEEALLDMLMAYTKYEVTVLTIANNGQRSAYSQPLRIATLPGLPSAPQNLSIIWLHSNAVQIQWGVPVISRGPLKSFSVLYTLDQTLEEQEWTVKSINGTAQMTIIDGLKPNCKYYLKIRASTSAGSGEATALFEVSTKPADPVPTGEVKMGIIIGVLIGGSCIIICIILMIVRYRFCGPRALPAANVPTVPPRHYYLDNGNGWITHEMTPLPTVNSENYVDSKGRENAENCRLKAKIMPNGKVKTIVLRPDASPQLPYEETLVAHGSLDDIDHSDASSTVSSRFDTAAAATSSFNGLLPPPSLSAIHQQQLT